MQNPATHLRSGTFFKISGYFNDFRSFLQPLQALQLPVQPHPPPQQPCFLRFTIEMTAATNAAIMTASSI